jgi:hypothetical protein
MTAPPITAPIILYEKTDRIARITLNLCFAKTLSESLGDLAENRLEPDTG